MVLILFVLEIQEYGSILYSFGPHENVNFNQEEKY